MRLSRSDGSEQHEVVFAVTQRNLDVVEAILLDRSTPGQPQYQQWLSYEEIVSLTGNRVSTDRVWEWLIASEANITWESRSGQYIRAIAPIRTWERLLDAEYYVWEDQSRSLLAKDTIDKRPAKRIHRSSSYSLPSSLKEHVATVFHTVQVPPEYKPKYRMKHSVNLQALPSKTPARSFWLNFERIWNPKKYDGVTTISLLKSHYKIGSLVGNASLSQSVFETADEYFSPDDLASFQKYFDLPSQEAIAKNGHDISQCSLSSSGAQCSEGNLDIQYIMGIAAKTKSYYWYVSDNNGNSDPFVTWLLELADEDNPPTSNSISWGAVEQVRLSIFVKHGI